MCLERLMGLFLGSHETAKTFSILNVEFGTLNIRSHACGKIFYTLLLSVIEDSKGVCWHRDKAPLLLHLTRGAPAALHADGGQDQTWPAAVD